MRILSCQSPYGQGGVGQHFAQLVRETQQSDQLAHYYNPAPHPDDGTAGRPLSSALFSWLYDWTPVRYSTSWASYLKNECFDRCVAATLDRPTERFMGFTGQSLHSFRRARDLGTETLELVAVNSHVDNVWRLHQRAAADTGIHDSWLNGTQRRKMKAEYALADRIYVHSEYTRTSFIEAGISRSKLRRTILKVDPRFQPAASPPVEDRFHIVYVGRLDATKGLPLLLDAFAQLPRQAELTLVGGWSSRRMRRYLTARQAEQPRLHIAPGDPLPVLHTADVFVHPSYEDGFGYAPMEALTCNVPVIVTEDTGMKESVVDGYNGYIIPTGDGDALLDRLRRLCNGSELSHSFLPQSHSAPVS
jgi:glycosyltransferase involved in cell wall biosynthesis